MRVLRHGVVPYMVVLGLVLCVSPAVGEQEWPSRFDYTIGVSTDKASRVQTSASLSGPIGENLGLKIGGWWIMASDENRAFVGDAYVDYTERPVYAAVGRKFVPFGPAGMLVSPGIFGAELRLDYERVTVQAIAGSLQFTPVTGGTRFTYAGNRVPSDEDIRAGRVAFMLTEPAAEVPVTLGLNMIDILDDTGKSADISIGATKWLTLFGEIAEYDDVDANVYGVRLSDEKLSRSPKNRPTILVLYRRDVPVDFVPAAAGATAYFEKMTGWAGGLYQELSARHAVGIFADRNDAILTLFGHVPL